MKKLLTFIAIFGLGAITFALLNMYILNPQEVPKEATPVIETPVTNDTPVTPAKEMEEELPPTTTTITPDGSLLDGPFIIFDSKGNKTEATVEIVRSPEETLLQFSEFEGELSDNCGGTRLPMIFRDNKNKKKRKRNGHKASSCR